MRLKLAAGNWKMNGTRVSLDEVRTLRRDFASAPVEILICPPATLIAWACDAVGSAPIRIGGQDCHAETSGAHTGDVSAAQLADAGATHVILGHSERRTDHDETDALVAEKTRAGWDAGLTAIVCVGETGAERDRGATLDVIGAQLAASLPDGATARNSVIAYEPVWAIGTGRTPTLAEIAEVHDFIRDRLRARFGSEAEGMRLLYGGSVKPSNAADIFAVPNVDGALVGGASLKASDFGQIIAALGHA